VKKLLLSSIFAALFCVGCAHPTWMPYVGAQQSWPTSPGAFTDTNRSLLVYYGYPPVDYIVIGQINVWSQNEIGGLVGGAADKAKAMGADAMIVGPSISMPVGGVLFAQTPGSPGSAFGSAFAAPMMQHDLSAVAIKWKNATGNPTVNPPKLAPVARNLRGPVALNHR
jgi:hypothetical protein